MVSIFLLCFNFPPCVPPYNGLRSTSLFKLPPPTFHHTMVFNLLLYFNFPPCVPPYNGLRSTSLFKLPPPYVPPYNGLQSTSLFQLPPLRSTIQWSPWSPSISFLYLNFCIPPYNSLHGLHSTSVFKLSPRVCLCITFFVILSVLTGLVNIF